MSWLSDIGKFELFHTKDVLKKIKDNPERLLLGGFGTDPFTAKITNKALGTNYEPLVDQMGGAYGGHTISAFGNNDGGVYKRAQDAGINTSAGAGAQDVAHLVAAMYAGGYAGDQLGALGGSSGSMSPATSGYGEAVNGVLPEVTVTGSQGAAPAASSGGGLLSGFGGEAGGGGSSFAQQGMGLLNQGQPQQQQAPAQFSPQQKDPRAQQMARMRMEQEMRMQALRQKPNKTLEEWRMLQQQPGLLGGPYG